MKASTKTHLASSPPNIVPQCINLPTASLQAPLLSPRVAGKQPGTRFGANVDDLSSAGEVGNGVAYCCCTSKRGV